MAISIKRQQCDSSLGVKYVLFRGSGWLKSELQKSFSFPYQQQADGPDRAEEVWSEAAGLVRVVAPFLGVSMWVFYRFSGLFLDL